MSKKIFVDSDVILDILCQREPYYEYAAYVFSLSDTRKIVLYTTSLVFSNVYYILRKLLGIQKAKEMDYFVKKATEMIIEEINKKRLTIAST